MNVYICVHIEVQDAAEVAFWQPGCHLHRMALGSHMLMHMLMLVLLDHVPHMIKQHLGLNTCLDSSGHLSHIHS